MNAGGALPGRPGKRLLSGLNGWKTLPVEGAVFMNTRRYGFDTVGSASAWGRAIDKP